MRITVQHQGNNVRKLSRGARKKKLKLKHDNYTISKNEVHG